MFICSARASSTTLTTKLPVVSTFRSVSFFVFSVPGAIARTDEENAIVGGSPVIAMKKLNGATFFTPSASTVDTQAMGRGTTQPMRSLYTASALIFSGSNSTVSPFRVRVQRRPGHARVDDACRLNLRHHLRGEQLHRAAPQRGLVPVVAAHQQRAEVARLLAQRHELVEHASRAARDDERPLDHVHRHVLVGQLEVGLQHEERLAALARS